MTIWTERSLLLVVVVQIIASVGAKRLRARALLGEYGGGLLARSGGGSEVASVWVGASIGTSAAGVILRRVPVAPADLCLVAWLDDVADTAAPEVAVAAGRDCV